MYIIYIYEYKRFSIMLNKGLRKNLKNRRDGEIGKQAKWNGSIEYEIEVKQTS